MDFEKICRERFSVRKFSNREVEKEKLDRVLQMIRLAPTARNNQPYEIFIANTQDTLNKIKESRDTLFGAPVVLVVCSDEEKNWNHPHNEKNSTLQDIGIVCATAVYACYEVGLGSLYVCAFDPNAVKKSLGLKENLIPETLIFIGYPSEDCSPNPRHFERRELSEFVHELK